jgi:hypothetical protein
MLFVFPAGPIRLRDVVQYEMARRFLYGADEGIVARCADGGTKISSGKSAVAVVTQVVG